MLAGGVGLALLVLVEPWIGAVCSLDSGTGVKGPTGRLGGYSVFI